MQPTNEQYASETISTERESTGGPFWRMIPRVQGASSKVVSVLSGGGVVRYQSDPIRWLLGYEPSDLVGRPLREVVHERSHEALENALERMAGGRDKFDQWRLRFRSSVGNRRWLEGMASNFLRDPRLGGILVYWRELPG